MSPVAAPRYRPSFRLAALALVPVVGVWLGHTVEYVRVWGTTGLATELTGSVHAYMLPLGAILSLLCLLVGRRAAWHWARLGRRRAAADHDVRLALRGALPTAPGPSGLAAGAPRLITLAGWYTVAQILLYLLQENLEMIVAGHAAPGLGPLTGIHAWAPFEQALIAIDLAAAVTAVARVWSAHVGAVRRTERLIRALVATARRPRVSAIPLVNAIRVLAPWVGGLAGRAPPVCRAI